MDSDKKRNSGDLNNKYPLQVISLDTPSLQTSVIEVSSGTDLERRNEVLLKVLEYIVGFILNGGMRGNLISNE